jgi:sulfur-oxidizing protein SoxB
MVDASLLLGVDIMTAHWEFTFGAERVKQIIANHLEGKMEFLAQNVVDNEWNEPVFKPYVIREINKIPVAIIGQAFPYTPIANPRHLIPDWSFGINEERMQEMVDTVRGKGAVLVVVISHNGMDVDLKLASRVRGIDVIMGGHTHDAVPAPVLVDNPGGKTLVTNAGSNGKFLALLDMDVKGGKLRDYRYKLLPVFSNLIEPDREMTTLIDKIRKPYKSKLEEKLAVTEDLLYRRGNFNGTFDQLILDALIEVKGADIAFSPGFRWGTSLLPGDTITFEHVMDQTSITYPAATLNEMTGERIKEILEDVADNLFNTDPYYQQGGDMVRVGGLKFTIDPSEKIGKRISNMTLKGKPLSAAKKYKVAGWASVQENASGEPVWDIVAGWLRHKKTVRIRDLNVPTVKGYKNDPGFEST